MGDNAAIIGAVAGGFLLGFLAAMIIFGYFKGLNIAVPLAYKYQWDEKGNLTGVYPLPLPK